jgi:hypothetical protein
MATTSTWCPLDSCHHMVTVNQALPKTGAFKHHHSCWVWDHAFAPFTAHTAHMGTLCRAPVTMHLQPGTLAAHLDTIQRPCRVPGTMHLQLGTLAAPSQRTWKPLQGTWDHAFAPWDHAFAARHPCRAPGYHTAPLQGTWDHAFAARVRCQKQVLLSTTTLAVSGIMHLQLGTLAGHLGPCICSPGPS